jgi:polar amino acid transport system substrate-binding protein
MKNDIRLFLGVCMIIMLLCGCSNQNTDTAVTQEDLPKLKIGIDDSYEPYSYVDENGEYAGLDIELATEACRRMGREPVFVAIKWDNKKQSLKDGTIDCIWSCFSMNGREDTFEWAGPYMYSRQMVVVRDNSDIENLKDLSDKRVAVVSSTKPESIFLEHNSDKIPEVRDVYCMSNMEQVFFALQYGYADAVAGHENVMRQYMETVPGEYRLLDEELQSVEVGVAFDKEQPSPALEELRQALQEMEDDGTLQNILEEYEISVEDTDGGEVE